ncbi:hypothetical protein Desor_2611 [Desulfosporosinus orientis DSM 765]|uniref:Uncharacterized protein n=1 Tax=Desulfosporosinus orientis (strain ATCC 19365 / DSM 765 / NCIMB 8382 / VKM B-1628 / Singapore I) TaxID=768706 RepID=G7W6F4_DESOD|nr:hypothetical protein [Desulfosporosinus orientis]AET68161.1 hypothetical protein Desor_2611 [Desulfosporosinus orientis DSM 765]
MSDTAKETAPEKQQEKSITELFEELKKDLDFLPDDDAVREGYLFAYKYFLVC